VEHNEESGMDVPKGNTMDGCFTLAFERIKKYAPIALLSLVILLILFQIARATVYKIRPWERGLHVRGGKFLAVDEPGWHFQIPFVDTVIGVTVSEQLGEIEQLAAMTSDEVTMDVSSIYTYRVTDPVQYRLEVLDPVKIVSRFVQATLRDEINTKSMSDVMHNRAEINQGLLSALREKESQYGIEFVTVQLQSASPPSEVVGAIKDRMVAVEKHEQAQTEALQMQTLADAEAYATEKRADAEAYQIYALAAAEAELIVLTSAAELEAAEAMLRVLEGKGELAEQYLQMMLAQELRENSKWIITGPGEFSPALDLLSSP
jgi:regulator of protease activity HflC (stomatin/prohibitin superfamily)